MQRIRQWFIVLVALFSALPVFAADNPVSFTDWLRQFKPQAEAEGIARQTIEQAFRDVRYLPWVIAADQRQPEFQRTFTEYLAARVSEKRVVQGRRMLRENRPLLERIAKKYRVQAHYLVALWGIESNYGSNTGKVPLVSALATLAYDARRSSFFKRELIILLRLLDSGQLEKDQLFGSWAGAMGQLQFMPSTFLGFAVDGNADGRIDLWRSKEDYLSSAANYLHKSGWQWRYRWGREVSLLPAVMEPPHNGMQYRAPLGVWQMHGVRLLNGDNLPRAELPAALLLPEGRTGQMFLVYDNYSVLLRWNRAHSFALAVGLLADKIAANTEAGRD